MITVKVKSLKSLPGIIRLLKQKNVRYTYTNGQTSDVYIDMSKFNSVIAVDTYNQRSYVEVYSHIKFDKLLKYLQPHGYTIRYQPHMTDMTLYDILTTGAMNFTSLNPDESSSILDLIKDVEVIDSEGHLQPEEPANIIHTIGYLNPIIKVKIYIDASWHFIHTYRPCMAVNIKSVLENILDKHVVLRVYHHNKEWLIETSDYIGQTARGLKWYERMNLILNRSSISGYWNQIYRNRVIVRPNYHDIINHLRNSHQSIIFSIKIDEFLPFVQQLDCFLDDNEISSLMSITFHMGMDANLCVEQQEDGAVIELLTEYNMNDEAVNRQLIDLLYSNKCRIYWGNHPSMWYDNKQFLELYDVEKIIHAKKNTDQLLGSMDLDKLFGLDF